MSSSVLGIGAALSAVVWIGVLSFIALAWVDDRRRGFDEDALEWSREDARSAKSGRPTATISGVDLADVDGVDLTAPARPIELVPDVVVPEVVVPEVVAPDVVAPDVVVPDVVARDVVVPDVVVPHVVAPDVDVTASAPPVDLVPRAEAPTWSARSEAEAPSSDGRDAPEHKARDRLADEAGSWVRYLGVVVLIAIAVARRVVGTRRLRL